MSVGPMTDIQAANYLMQRMRQDPHTRDTVRVICQSRGHADLVAWANADPESLVMFAESERNLEPIYENPDLNHIQLEEPPTP